MRQTIILPLRPMPAPRPRVTAHGTYNPKRYTNYKIAVRHYAMAEKLKPITTGAVRIGATFIFATPKSWTKKKTAQHLGEFHTQKPDLDNLEKGIKDALSGIAYRDDAQVSILHSIKMWGEVDRIIVEIEPVSKSPQNDRTGANLLISTLGNTQAYQGGKNGK